MENDIKPSKGDGKYCGFQAQVQLCGQKHQILTFTGTLHRLSRASLKSEVKTTSVLSLFYPSKIYIFSVYSVAEIKTEKGEETQEFQAFILAWETLGRCRSIASDFAD